MSLRQHQDRVNAREKANFTEKRVLEIFAQTCMAVNYLHEKYIIHGEISLENIFLEAQSGRISVIGAGLQAIKNQEEAQCIDINSGASNINEQKHDLSKNETVLPIKQLKTISPQVKTISPYVKDI